MIRVAVCDDDWVYLDDIVATVTALFEMKGTKAEVWAFSDGEKLLDEHRRSPFDVLFLDIDIPQISGFDIAKAVRAVSSQPYVIFVTAKHELVYDSFEYQPFYFICKTVQSDLCADLQHVVDKLHPLLKQNKVLYLPDGNVGEIAVPVKDILYIQSDKHYLYYYRINDPVPLRERAMLAAKEEALRGFDFFKPHRRFLVNMKYVNRFDLVLHAMTMVNGDNIPISKALRDEAFEAYKNFMRR